MTAICNILNGEFQPASVHCGFHFPAGSPSYSL